MGHGLSKVPTPELLHHAHIQRYVRFGEDVPKVQRQAIFSETVGRPGMALIGWGFNPVLGQGRQYFVGYDDEIGFVSVKGYTELTLKAEA